MYNITIYIFLLLFSYKWWHFNSSIEGAGPQMFLNIYFVLYMKKYTEKNDFFKVSGCKQFILATFKETNLAD